jgi:hypothetical protein
MMPNRRKPQDIRRRGTKELKEDHWLFICEGEKTEPNYFEKLESTYKQKGHTPCFKKEGGKGTNKVLVEYAKRYIATHTGVAYRIVFVVFDNDVDGSEKQFDQAVAMCQKAGYFALWSNKCFELWLYLHVHYLETALTPNLYCEKLCHAYKDGGLMDNYDKTSEEIYKEINTIGNLETARQNAKKLYQKYGDNKAKHLMNPCTTMFKLFDLLDLYQRDRMNN